MSHRSPPRWLRGLAVIAAAGALAACASKPEHGHGMHHGGPMANATLAPTKGNAVNGKAVFHQMGDHLMVHVRLTGLPPNTEHGFHLHEKGDCSAPDAMSAGGHFNPTGQPHGPQDAAHHAGDMPNLKADGSGKVDQKFSLHGVSIDGTNAIVGRGLIVHDKPDDYATQPTGNSGGRIACGVVTPGH